MTDPADEFVTFQEAQERFGLSRFKLTHLAKSAPLTIYRSPRDRREKLLRVRDIESALVPQPESAEDTGKAAA